MSNQKFLKEFEELRSDVRDLKTNQQRVILYLENSQNFPTEINHSLLEEKVRVKEACRMMDCSEPTLWKLRKEGILPFTRIGRSIRFNKIDILNYLNQKG